MKKISISNLVFIAIVIALIIPQSRQSIQVFIHKGLALFSPSITSSVNREVLTNYNWDLQSIDGMNYNLSDAQEKVLLVNFWATWCPPCIAEMPALQELQNDYKDTVEFVFVSNEASETIQTFLDKNNYTFNVYRPISETPEALATTSIPRTLIIDKKGTIVIDKTGAANWNSDAVRSTLNGLLSN